jgi:hypothetical protein
MVEEGAVQVEDHRFERHIVTLVLVVGSEVSGSSWVHADLPGTWR